MVCLPNGEFLWFFMYVNIPFAHGKPSWETGEITGFFFYFSTDFGTLKARSLEIDQRTLGL